MSKNEERIEKAIRFIDDALNAIGAARCYGLMGDGELQTIEDDLRKSDVRLNDLLDRLRETGK